MAQHVREAALAALDEGLSVVRIRADGTKRPEGGWKRLQGRPAAPSTVTRWFPDDSDLGLGVICGEVSGGLEMIEVEGRAIDEGVSIALVHRLEERGHMDLVKRLWGSGCVIESPRGGFNALYRCAVIEGNTKLATRLAREDELTDDERQRVAEGKPWPIRVLIETRGEGGYLIVPPTNGLCHPNGRPWVQVRGDFSTIPTITPGERDVLWSAARSLDQLPRADTPRRTKEASSQKEQTSVLDLGIGDGPKVWEEFDRTHTGHDVLTAAGFQPEPANRKSTANGASYTRPGKNPAEGTSATVWDDDGTTTLFSTSIGAPAEFTSGRRKLKPWQLHVALNYGGDFSRAAKDYARELGYGTTRQAPPGVDPETGEVLESKPPAGAPVLPEEFWTARAELGVVRDAARSRRVAPDSVLGAVLARIAVETSHNVKLPAVTGAPCGLTYYVALVSPPGAGKSGSQRVAALLVPASMQRPEVPSGSGEGLLEQLFGMVPEEQPDGNTKDVRRQVRHGAHVVIGEGTQLFETAGRAGSTTLSVIREAYTDGVLGNTNASEDRRRVIPAGQAVYGVALAMQPEKAGPLLADADAGTPQRFAWFAAVDPTAPDQRPEWPEFTWRPPETATMPNAIMGNYNRSLLEVDPDVLAEIDSRRLEVLRGTRTVDAMDEHRDLVRLKTAGLLALLAGRVAVDPDDWHLAGIVVDNSTAVRDWTRSRLRFAEERREVTFREKLVGREEHSEAAERRRVTQLAVGVIARKVRRDGTANRSTLNTAMPGKYRSVVSLDEVIAEAVDLDYIRLDGEVYIPGEKVHK